MADKELRQKVTDLLVHVDQFGLHSQDIEAVLGVVRDAKVAVHKQAIRYNYDHQRGLVRARKSVTAWHTDQIEHLLKDKVEENKRKDAELL